MRHPVVYGCLFAAVICCLGNPDVDAGDNGRLRVATFCSDVTPPLGSPTYRGTPLETVETPLLAKGIVLDDGRQRYVLCAVDWCGLCGSSQMIFRSKIAAGAGTDVSNVTVHTVHQHTAPYLPIFTQKQKPDRFVAVAAYGDLATGYICTEEAFSEGGYEPSASHVAPKSEAILKNAVRRLLELE